MYIRVLRNSSVFFFGDMPRHKMIFPDSEYRQAMNLALLNLQEGGVLREMKYRWWKEMHGGGACQVHDDDNNSDTKKMHLLYKLTVTNLAL